LRLSRLAEDFRLWSNDGSWFTVFIECPIDTRLTWNRLINIRRIIGLRSPTRRFLIELTIFALEVLRVLTLNIPIKTTLG
jgi:hypothetical protein